jgi:hypothetical protein
MAVSAALETTILTAVQQAGKKQSTPGLADG